MFAEPEKLGIHAEAVTDKLRIDGVNLFGESFDELLTNLEQKQEHSRTPGPGNQPRGYADIKTANRGNA